MENTGRGSRENKMGTMPVGRLLLTMSLPMVISMLVQALYNVVDSVFVSRISENALTAVSLSFPMQNLIIGTAVGMGVGVNALLSKSLGEKNYTRADRVAQNGVFIAALCSVLFLLVGLFLTNLFFTVQTDDAEIIRLGTSYLSVCSCLSFGVFGQIMFERLMQSTGRTVYTMFTQGLGAVINLILDPILIFGLFGIPALGVAGAAYATVIGQICAMVFAVFLNARVNPDVHLHFRSFRPDIRIMREIFSIGFPSVVMNGISSVMTFLVNRILIGFTTTAAAVFGVYFKLQSFVFMPVFGLNNGMVPIISFSYGAGNRRRLIRTLRLSLAAALGIMTLGTAVMQLFPGLLLSFFHASQEMIEIGVPALRTISLCFIPAAFCIIFVSLFQAMGKGIFSMLVSIARQLVILVPAAWLLSRTGVLSAVWWAFPIAEAASVLVCVGFLMNLYRKLIAPLPDGAPV